MEATEKRDRRRGAFEVLCKTAEDIASWFLPFVMVDGVAQSMRAFLMESTDLRGPWECLWHKVGKLRAQHTARFLLTSARVGTREVDVILIHSNTACGLEIPKM